MTVVTENDYIVRKLSDPKSSVAIFDLPCGFLDETGQLLREVEVKEMTGAEEDMLISQHSSMSKKMNQLIISCTNRIGNITDRERIHKIVSELPSGDRVFLLFAIRMVTLGEEYPFKQACPKCELEKIYTVKLSDLTIKEMPDPKKRIYDHTLPSGRVVRFKILTGADEGRTVVNIEDAVSLSMLLRVELLDNKPPTLADLKGLSHRDRLNLREQFEKVDGGIDTSLEMTCPSCGHEYDSELEVAQVGFFFPTARSLSKKKSSI